MKSFKKSALSMAMTTALLAGGLLAVQQASAFTQVLPTPTVAGDADPYVSLNGMGQALIYPYYTVRGGFKTTFNVFNTSPTHAVAVKVRFREYQNSRDVLDFNLVLSPNDKWSGNVVEDAATGARLTTGDSSCTVPAISASGAPFSAAGYSFNGSAVTGGDPALNFVDSGEQGNLDRLKSGYIEIIPMAWSATNRDNAATTTVVEGVFAASLHRQPAGVPADCSVVVAAFTPSVAWNTSALGNVAVGNGAPPITTRVLTAVEAAATTITTDNAGDPLWNAIPDDMNPLFGELALINTDGGVAGGTNAIALADWMQKDTPLLTAQEFPFYLEPTLATANGIWDTRQLPLTDAALNASVVMNEWANNPANGAKVAWAVTMPTKSFHVDVDVAGLQPNGVTPVVAPITNLGNIQSGSSDYRVAGPDGTAYTAVSRTPLAPFQNWFANGVSESTVALGLYDAEEGTTTSSGSVSFSPGSFTSSSASLKYEASTISFDGGNGDKVLNSMNALQLDPATDIAGDKVSGHLRLGVPGRGAGLPMVGFAMKIRDAGMPGLSFGQALDHKWR